MLAFRRLTNSASYIMRPSILTRSHPVLRRTLTTALDIPATCRTGFVGNFAHQVSTHSDRTAVIFDDQHLSYADIYRSALRCALFLREQHNIREGDVVACVTPQVATTHIISVAAKILNCAYFPINDSLSPRTIEDFAQTVDAKLIVCSDASLFTSHSNVLYIDETTGRWIGDDYHSQTPLPVMEDAISHVLHENTFADDVTGLLMLTSGSTALPKIVEHRANWAGFSDLTEMCDQATLITSEAYHASSYWMTLTHLCSGGTFVLPSLMMRDKCVSARAKALEMLRLSETHSVHTIPVIVSPVYEMVALNLAFPPSVKVLLSAGDIIPVTLMQKFMRLHAKNEGTVVVNAYGSTEVGIVGMSRPLLCSEENANDAQRVREELMFLDKNPTVQHRVDPETGELTVKTQSVMKGYFGAPQKTAEAMTDDGFFRMGDTVQVARDEGSDGALRFMVKGRQKQVIVTPKGYVFAQFIEDVLMEHKGVSGAVVIGADEADSAYKRPVAFVTLHLEKDARSEVELTEALTALVSQKRSAHEVPAQVFVLDSLPKNGVGKVNRNELTKMANRLLSEIEREAAEELTIGGSVAAYGFQAPQLQRQGSQ